MLQDRVGAPSRDPVGSVEGDGEGMGTGGGWHSVDAGGAWGGGHLLWHRLR